MAAQGKKKLKDIKKAHYYVMYLGWKECKGVYGREFTEPVVKDLVRKRAYEPLPKLTLEVSRKEIKIVQTVDKSKGKSDKIKYPSIPAKDVTYAVQALSPDTDVVACIYLGYNPKTESVVHVHVYKCDSIESASVLVDHINQIISVPEYQTRIANIEKELVSKGQIYGRSAYIDQQSDRISEPENQAPNQRARREPEVEQQRLPRPEFREAYAWNNPSSQVTSPPPGPPSPEDEYGKEKKFQAFNLAEEFKQKLSAPNHLLLPPTDYDTVKRKQGNLQGYESRRWKAFDPPADERDSAKGESDGGSQTGSGRGYRDVSDHVVDDVFAQHDFPPAGRIPQAELDDGKDTPKPNWVNELYAPLEDRQRGSRGGSSSNQYPQYQNGNHNDHLQPKVPHWKRQENFYHLDAGGGSNPPMSPRGGAERPMSPGPGATVPYDEWVSRPVGGEYYGQLGNPRKSNSTDEYPASPRSPYGLTRSDSYGHQSNSSSGTGDNIYPTAPQPRGGKKYTAAALGLTDQGPVSPRGPGRYVDEGYRSMDPRDNPRGRQPYDGPRDEGRRRDVDMSNWSFGKEIRM